LIRGDYRLQTTDHRLLVRDYRNIKVYKLADALVTEIYKITKKFPKEELYGLTSQLRRAGLSVVTNIVEGASRKHKQSYFEFLVYLPRLNCRGKLSFGFSI